MSNKITETTELKCDKGSTPSFLSVTSQAFMKIENKLQATEEDKNAFTNIKPFGACSISKNPCIPFPTLWEHTSVFKIDDKKELLERSTCKCSVGGKISISRPAQQFVSE